MCEKRDPSEGACMCMAHCPLCGEVNHCQFKVPENSQKAGCWCRAETFPPALLSQLPEGERNSRCICMKCLKRFSVDPPIS